MKKIIFNISGGMGKNIIATGVVKLIAKHYPDHKIYITSPYEEIWRHNPLVTEIISIEKSPNFIRDNIKDPETIVFRHDPYHTSDFAYQKTHMIEIWAKICGVPYEENIKPELFFTDAELDDAKRLIGEQKNLFIQTSGGAPNQEFPISWARDLPIPTAQKVVDEAVKRGYKVFHIRRENQIPLENTTLLNRPIREVLAAIHFSTKRLLIDSIAEHAAAAIGKPSVVCWVGNRPEVFSYKIHTNILPVAKEQFRHRIDSYFDLYNITGALHECPYDTNMIFDEKKIISELFGNE